MEVKELIKHIPYTATGISHLKKQGLIKTRGRGVSSEPFEYNLKEIKETLGIPKDRFNEKLLLSREVDVLLRKHGIKYKRFGKLAVSISLSRLGHFDGYFFRRGRQRGSKVLFLEGDIMEFIKGSGGKLYEYRIDFLEEMSKLVLGLVPDKNKDIMSQWIRGGQLDDIAESLGITGSAIGQKIKEVKQRLPELIRKRIADLLQQEVLHSRIAELEQENALLKEFKGRFSSPVKITGDVNRIQIRDLDVGCRNQNVCRNQGIETVKDLLEYGKLRYKRIQNVGTGSVVVMNDALERLNVIWK